MPLQLLLPALLAQTALGPTPAPTPAPPACATADHRAFDFWVGRWDVSRYGTATVIAHSLIERLYAGCAIRENWMPIGKTGGGSLSNFDASDRKWHQTWVDSSGTRALFDGGVEGEAMVLIGFWRGAGPNGEDGYTRMTYTREPGGKVRQRGAFSTDRNAWIATFDFLYTPSKS
jgi:hypothetical protein